MIEPIRHYALTAWPSVHDEEAMSSLELQARTAAKVNEAVEVINSQIEIINSELSRVPYLASMSVKQAIADGVIADQLNGELMDALRANLATLQRSIDQANARISSIVAQANPTDGNSELIDARLSSSNTLYATLGNHVRALGTGEALDDAIRPGVVKPQRIMAGNLGGDFEDRFTLREYVPLAGKWERTGYYDMDSLGYTEHSGYSITAKIPCEYGDTYFIKSYLYGPKVRPAVVFDAGGRALEVIGEPGRSNWDPVLQGVQVGHKDAAYISFVCGGSYLAQFTCQRASANPYPDALVAMAGRGYIHMHAKKRTDTVTDRAQIKAWFELPATRSADDLYMIPLQLFEAENVSDYTFRLFGSVNDASYDVALPESASGYKYSSAYGIRPVFKVPLETSEGVSITHVSIFVDILPINGDAYMDATIPPLYMHRITRDANPDPIPGTGYALHGALDTDTLNIVLPGSTGATPYRKKILGMGDSLMSGNTLRKSDSWFNLAAGARDMEHYNAAVNGLPVSGADGMATRIIAALAAMPAPDYFILQGGANDKRLNLPLAGFRQAIRDIVSAVRTASPRCKIILATNWRRTISANTLGLYDADYVAAMLEEAETLGVPCVNNYADGLNLLDPSTAAWADEGLASGGSSNIHFSRAANEAIATRYTREIENI